MTATFRIRKQELSMNVRGISHSHLHYKEAKRDVVNSILEGEGKRISFLVGPSGAGKTTLLKDIKKIFNHYAKRVDYPFAPPLLIELDSETQYGFSFNAFYSDLLEQLGDILISRKADLEEERKRLLTAGAKAKREASGKGRNSKVLLRAVISALREVQPSVIIVDEAHVMLKGAQSATLKKIAATWKSIANKSDCPFLLSGTNELRDLIYSGSTELLTRGNIIDLPNYHPSKEAKEAILGAFRKIIENSGIKLSFAPRRDETVAFLLLGAGFRIGELNHWIARAIGSMPSKNFPTLTLDLLKKTRKPDFEIQMFWAEDNEHWSDVQSCQLSKTSAFAKDLLRQHPYHQSTEAADDLFPPMPSRSKGRKGMRKPHPRDKAKSRDS